MLRHHAYPELSMIPLPRLSPSSKPNFSPESVRKISSGTPYEAVWRYLTVLDMSGNGMANKILEFILRNK